jgi:hypothetical protein
MKKKLFITGAFLLSLAVISCGSKKDSAASIAQKWCDLNGKAFRAADGPAKDAAKASLDKYENEMEAKYKNDEAFMKEVEKEVNKCEGASEGK